MTIQPKYIPAPAADFVLPFDLPELGVRGRLVRLDKTSTRALNARVLPEPAARVLAEKLALSTLLGSALKLDGRLTVQTKSDGPLDLATVDYRGAGSGRPIGLRGFARLDEARFVLLGDNPGFPLLVGEGALAITIEPKVGGETYQGIVQLSEDGVAASAEIYFQQSEQLATAIRLAGAPVYEAGMSEAQWRAGGMMLQATPERQSSIHGSDDDWDRLTLFLKSLEDFELLDTALPAEDLLWRLFHEDEVRLHRAERIEFRCDCDGARIASVLKSYTPQDRESLADPDGIIRARCEFCATVHEIAPGDIETDQADA
ncbi:MAG: Hsp33 family molecular chaperone HslO [Proteobacteria bacterium]|nr:Hsp33 family molecular chaperone HslO [Pseudomonadota bacterium]